MSDPTEPSDKNPTEQDEPAPNELDDLVALGGDTGFDYSAFEESLSDLESEESDVATDPGITTETTHERLTLDTQHVPKDDATWHTRELGQYTVFTIRGRINEAFDGADAGSKLRGRVIFDLAEVDRITSFGVRAWLQMLDSASLREAVFYRASTAVVNQITMMRNFCGPAKLHSLIAPYSCASCGAEFGVPYESVEDRSMLRSRNPAKVACPQCQASAEMDEDPWVFFAVDEQLLEEISPDLDRVLSNIGEVQQHSPIEKTFHDNVTKIRFNGDVTKDTRFQRAFSGLEGEAVLDLRTAKSVSPAGTHALITHLNRMSEDVTCLDIEGSPLDLLEHVLDNRDPRIRIRSVATTVRSLARPLERRVIVDLKRERAVLTAGLPLDVDVPWRDDPLSVEGMALLQRAAPAFDFGATPPPISQHGTPMPVSATPAPAPRQGLGQTDSSMVYAAAGALVFLLILSLGVVGFWMYKDEVAAVPVPLQMPKVAAAPAIGEWSTGGAAPPTWSDSPVKQEDGVWIVVGHGDADSSVAAAKAARSDAIAVLLELIRTRIPQNFEDEALAQAGPERAAAIETFERATAGLNFERREYATLETNGEHEVAAQFALTTEELDAFLADFASTETFKGMGLVQSAPWARPGVRLLRRQSYVRNVREGDRLVQVGNSTVANLHQFRQLAPSQFGSVPSGGILTLVFDREGTPVTTTVTKRAVAQPIVPRPGPSDPERPTLFTKDK